MIIVRNTSFLMVSALLAFVVTTALGRYAQAGAAGNVPVTADISRVPARADIHLVSIPLSDPVLKTSASQAISAALAEFGLDGSLLDPTAGVVSARLTQDANRNHQDEPAWIVTVDAPIRGQGPGSLDTIFQKMCIVIDPLSGRYLFAYWTDPVVASASQVKS